MKDVMLACVVTPAYIFRTCDLISSNAASFCTPLPANTSNEVDVTARKKSWKDTKDTLPASPMVRLIVMETGNGVFIVT